MVDAANNQAPPTDLLELEAYMRDTVGKEIRREDIEFGAELGVGEFGSVCEGRPIRNCFDFISG